MADVTDATFETDVVQRSHQVPVVVDLWAEWCGPCKTLGPILDKVIGETNGAVELAKVDVDANPAVAQAFRVQSIPAVYAMVNGEIVDGFMGAQSEAQVREFVEKLAPTEEQNEVERLLDIGDVPSLNQAYALEPDNPNVLTALAGKLIEEGQIDQGLALLDKIPESPTTRHLRALARTGGESMDDVEETLAALLPTVKFNDDDRQKFVDLLEVLGPEDPRTADWRRKLSTAFEPIDSAAFIAPPGSPRSESDAARVRRNPLRRAADAPGPRRALRTHEVGVAGVVVELAGEGSSVGLAVRVAG